MQIFSAAMKLKNHTRSIPFTHFSSQRKHQRLNISKDNTASGWVAENSFKSTAMFGFHDVDNNKPKVHLQSIMIAINKVGVL